MSESSLESMPLAFPIRGILVIYNYLHQPVTGLGEGEFTTTLTYEGVVSSIPVTISEVGNGRYLYSFTATSPGEWYLSIIHSTYNPRGWDEEFRVEGDIGASSGGAYPWGVEMRRDHMQDRRDREDQELARDDEDAIMTILLGIGLYE